MARRRKKRGNPPSLLDVVFQIGIGVVTAVAAAMAIDKMREVRERSALPQRDPQGYDVT